MRRNEVKRRFCVQVRLNYGYRSRPPGAAVNEDRVLRDLLRLVDRLMDRGPPHMA